MPPVRSHLLMFLPCPHPAEFAFSYVSGAAALVRYVTCRIFSVCGLSFTLSSHSRCFVLD